MNPTNRSELMFRMIAVSVLALSIAGPAFAGATCTTATKDMFKPQADLKAMLAKDGMTVKKIKTEKGCYEAYGTDKDGKKFNIAFNAETLEKVDNPEAGQN